MDGFEWMDLDLSRLTTAEDGRSGQLESERHRRPDAPVAGVKNRQYDIMSRRYTLQSAPICKNDLC